MLAENNKSPWRDANEGSTTLADSSFSVLQSTSRTNAGGSKRESSGAACSGWPNPTLNRASWGCEVTPLG